MKNIKSVVLVAFVAILTASCSVTMPYTATNNPIGSKKGVSKTGMLFSLSGGLSSGIVFNKNYGVIEAAKNGGITSVATVDVKVTNFFIFQKAEVIVTGE